jgi:hypothetical protein
MKVIWTKSSLPLSVLIRAVTGEDCSHLALVFESRDGGLMFESNLLGTHAKFYKNAKKHFTVVHEMNIPCTVEQEDAAWDIMVDKFDGKSYDFRGMIYLGICKLKNRLFGSSVPDVNAWGAKDAYFCDELYNILEQAGIVKDTGVSQGMMTPHDVWELTKKTP